MRSAVRARTLLVAAAVAVVTAAAVAAALALSGEPVRAARLPDLVQRTPYQLVGQTTGAGAQRRFRIGFASAVENHGSGPLIVRGSAGGRGRPMTAVQVVEWSDGSTTRRPGVGRLRYTRSTDHQHWHFLGFERYTLRAVSRGTVVRRDRKTGFCLGDRYNARPGRRQPAEPARPRWTQECGRNRPGLAGIEEGISVGYGDDYHPLLEGQYVDVTRLPAGRYELVHWVNADRRLRESSYRNNAASVVLEIGWPRGFASPPSIGVIRRCGDGKRCLTDR